MVIFIIIFVVFVSFQNLKFWTEKLEKWKISKGASVGLKHGWCLIFCYRALQEKLQQQQLKSNPFHDQEVLVGKVLEWIVDR